MSTDADYAAAQNYFEATGTWPEGFTPPGELTEEEKLHAAGKAYFDATGQWPGEKPKNVKREEAPEDGFSHYLELANGQTVRFADNPRKPGNFPSDWNGVPISRVHNAYSPGEESGQ